LLPIGRGGKDRFLKLLSMLPALKRLPASASLTNSDPNLCFFLTSLVSHHVDPIPRQWVLIKSIFIRFLILFEMITEITYKSSQKEEFRRGQSL
jgi:hypothetical protein